MLPPLPDVMFFGDQSTSTTQRAAVVISTKNPILFLPKLKKSWRSKPTGQVPLGQAEVPTSPVNPFDVLSQTPDG
jgi:hypothetical protein